VVRVVTYSLPGIGGTTKFAFLLTPTCETTEKDSHLLEGTSSIKNKLGVAMLWTIILILLIGWALGFFAFDVGAFIHLLLVIAIIVFIINLISGRRAV